MILSCFKIASAGSWDLDDFRLCKKDRLDRIRSEASAVAYNADTNTFWVVSRISRAIVEYTMNGDYVRAVRFGNAKLRDPEGISALVYRIIQ